MSAFVTLPREQQGERGGQAGTSALDALARAKAIGIQLALDGQGGIDLEGPALPAEIVAALKAIKPDLMRLLAGRSAAEAALRQAQDAAAQPQDCSEHVWRLATHGLKRFVAEGWGDQAALLGWTGPELYVLPELWSQIHLTGAAWLVRTKRVIAVTEASIIVESRFGSRLTFRRIGREHLA
jgi:hypothetical protein